MTSGRVRAAIRSIVAASCSCKSFFAAATTDARRPADSIVLMTVLVTGASGSIGPAVVAAFRRSFPEVRAYVRRAEAAEPLRQLGAKVAVGEADDPDTLGVAMYGVFTVCHLVGAVDAPDEDAYQEANAGYAEVFGDNKPSRATLVVDLTNPDFLVELVSYIEL